MSGQRLGSYCKVENNRHYVGRDTPANSCIISSISNLSSGSVLQQFSKISQRASVPKGAGSGGSGLASLIMILMIILVS